MNKWSPFSVLGKQMLFFILVDSNSAPPKGHTAVKRPSSPIQHDTEKKPKVDDSVQSDPQSSPCLSAEPAEKRPDSPLENKMSEGAKAEDVRQHSHFLTCYLLLVHLESMGLYFLNNIIFMKNAFQTMCCKAGVTIF